MNKSRSKISKVYFGAPRNMAIMTTKRAHAHAKRARTRTTVATNATVVGGCAGAQNIGDNNIIKNYS